MGLNFKDIISEDKNQSRDRFVENLLPMVKDHFVKKYPNDHWVRATYWMEDHDVNEYRLTVEKSKEVAGQLMGFNEKLKNVGKYTPKQIDVIYDEYFTLIGKYTTLMNRVRHISTLFGRSDSGGMSFIEKMALPLDIILDVWEKFYEEVYKPGKIEYNRQRDGLGLEYGLPDGDYVDLGTYSEQTFHLMKDNETEEFILIVNRDYVDWSSKGMDYDEIFYKRFKTKQEVISVMVDREFKELKNELFGAEVSYTDEEVQRSYDFLESYDIRVQELADADYDGDLDSALSELLVQKGIVDENRSQWGSDAYVLSKYLLRTYNTIKSFNF